MISVAHSIATVSASCTASKCLFFFYNWHVIFNPLGVFLYPCTSHDCSALVVTLVIILYCILDYVKNENSTFQVPWWPRLFKASTMNRSVPD